MAGFVPRNKKFIDALTVRTLQDKYAKMQHCPFCDVIESKEQPSNLLE